MTAPKPKNRMVKQADVTTRGKCPPEGGTPNEEAPPAPARTIVRANVRMAEAGIGYAPGDEFEVSYSRAMALGGLATIIKLTD